LVPEADSSVINSNKLLLSQWN